MPAETLSDKDWMEIVKIVIQVIGYIVTWLFVQHGWKVANSQNFRRDERKELRDLVSDICDSIRNVEADVVSFLTPSGEAKTSSYWTVHFGVRQVNSSLVTCSVLDTVRIREALFKYRQTLTGKVIQGPQSPLPTGFALDTALRDTSKAGGDLIRELENRYRELYPFTQKEP